MRGCPPLPPTSPHDPTAGWGLKGPLQIPRSHAPLPHGHHSSGCWVGHPHCEPPKEGQGNPARFCLTPFPQSPREQIKRSSDRDTKGLPEESLCLCRPSPYPPLKHLSHLPCAAPSLTQELLARSRGCSQHPERGDMGGHTRVPIPDPSRGRFCPLPSQYPRRVPPNLSPLPPSKWDWGELGRIIGNIGSSWAGAE